MAHRDIKQRAQGLIYFRDRCPIGLMATKKATKKVKKAAPKRAGCKPKGPC